MRCDLMSPCFPDDADRNPLSDPGRFGTGDRGRFAYARGHSRVGLAAAIRRQSTPPSRLALTVSILSQRVFLFQRAPSTRGTTAQDWEPCGDFIASTSRIGVGQKSGSNCTPLGLHRVARCVGGGFPVGTVFKNRVAIGLTWQGIPEAPIAHRILWLEGLEEGLNRGPGIDTFARYIYIHGVGDETTLGRPASIGCIHLSANDIIRLYPWIKQRTLVWIGL